MADICTHVFRLTPGQDLKQEIQKYVNDNDIKAGWISCCVGSLTGYVIRFANQATANKSTGHFEILSLAGTVSTNGSHIHICLGDDGGRTIGGHLMDGCLVYTTAEIVISSILNMVFVRAADPTTGWQELTVKAIT